MKKLIIGWLTNSLALWLASYIVPGFTAEDIAAVLIGGLLLGAANAVVKPVLIVLTLPITILTLGLFLLVINAAILGLVAWLLPGLSIEGFLPALLGWLIVVIVGWAVAQIRD
jgi:putative membrane protein